MTRCLASETTSINGNWKMLCPIFLTFLLLVEVSSRCYYCYTPDSPHYNCPDFPRYSQYGVTRCSQFLFFTECEIIIFILML